MTTEKPFPYTPNEHENEAASNSYLMSLIAIIVGLPLPIVNLVATFIFFLGNRKGTYFVRWHCTQALLSQLGMLFINSALFWWTVSIIIGEKSLSNPYFAYLFLVLAFNLTEFIVTIYTSINTRKGKHVSWWFFGDLTDVVCKPSKYENSI